MIYTSWHDIAWLPCVFLIINALMYALLMSSTPIASLWSLTNAFSYLAFVGLSARAIDRNKKRAKFGAQDRMAGLEEQ